MDLCWQHESLLFNMLSRFVIAFLSRSKHLLISWLQSPSELILGSLLLVLWSCCYSEGNRPRATGFGRRSVRMWELDHRECWALKNWCFQTVVLKKTLESPWDSKEIKPVNPKGNQPWVFIERTDAEAEAPILWPPDVKSWLTGKDPDAGKA